MPSLLLRLSANVLSVKMWIGDYVVVNDGDVLNELLRLYWVSMLPQSKVCR